MVLQESEVVILKNLCIYAEAEVIENGYSDKGQKNRIFGYMKSYRENDWTYAQVIDSPNHQKLIPGLIDIHIHTHLYKVKEK